jgi:thiamine biosynthesis lipoprotein ApbE
VAEIEKLESIFSRYKSDSELNLLAAKQGQTVSISSDLFRVLEWSEELRQMTQGAFDVRVRALLSSGSEIQTVVSRLKQPPYELHRVNSADPQVTILDWPEQGWTLDAVAKGYIMDQVAVLALKEFPGLKGVCINIGGDVRIAGELVVPIHVEDPFHAAEGSRPIASWKQLVATGIATSGGYRRFENSLTGRRSHLMDARTGRSAEQLASVTVVAPTAMQADGLATAVSVLGIKAGLELIESQELACLLVDASGAKHVSTRWSKVIGNQSQVSGKARADQSSESSTIASTHAATALTSQKRTGLHVHFELARPSGAAYRRPFLALWLEDADGFPVKTALLWLQNDQPGPRWHRDLTRWYRNDRARKTAEQKELIGVISGATRGPGNYHAHFDGSDNEGNPLPHGKYTLFLEVTREHGTHQLIRQSIDWSDQAIPTTKIEGNVEVSSFSFEYLPSETTMVSEDR